MTVISTRNQLIASALSKRRNTDPMMKWVTFADEFSVDSSSCIKDLNFLNSHLASKSVIIGGGLSPSEADVVVFAAVFSYVKSLEDSVKESLPHMMRWMDYIQNREDFGDTFEPILVQKDNFDPPASKPVEKVEVGSSAKKSAKDANTAEEANAPKSEMASKPVEKVEVGSSAKKSAKDANTAEEANAPKSEMSKKVSFVTTGEKKAPEKVAEGKAQTEKKKLPEKVVEEKDKDVSVSLLKIQVGLILKAEKHPSADSLLVEEIDTGDAKPRQVVSGLAKFCSPEELTNRLVVLITNVKPGKLRDVMSEGLVLCASSEDHTVVEPLIAPEGAKVGEIITFSGHDGKPEAVLNPKKKQLDKITPHLFTDDKGVATFKGIPFMTSAGPCTSSIPKASIK